MKTIVAGSRSITDINFVRNAIKSCNWKITEIVSGAARGVDRLGEAVAVEMGIPIALHPADWKRLGKAAGHIRNQEMSTYADALIACWDGVSPGTLNMIKTAKKDGLLVIVVRNDVGLLEF